MLSTPKKIFYFGLLGNVNYSIQSIRFDDRLTVEKWSKKKVVKFIAEMTDQNIYEVEGRFETIYDCGDRKSAYFLTGNMDAVVQEPKSDSVAQKVQYILKTQKHYEAFIEKIKHKVNLLRLCAKGDIKLSFSCFYVFDEHGKREFDATFENDLELRNWIFRISSNEIDHFNKFIETTNLPLGHEYLQLAFENFLLSYDVHDDRLSFLSLMIALETLFNDSTQELRYRLARGAAVFLGKSARESQQIFKDVRKLYDKRSTLVHTGDRKNITRADLGLLQNYVRNSLRLLIQCNLPKQELTNCLTAEAFGAQNRIRKLGGLK
jgi:hypothetical protein